MPIDRVASEHLTAASSSAHARSIALMKFLSGVAQRLGVAKDVYVVGGAVRNFLIDQPIKDIDVVIDSVKAGHDSEWFAKEIQSIIPTRTSLATNQYGVAILTIAEPWELDGHPMEGEVIEIANARKESYGGAGGKGYKPHLVEPATIEDDLIRREFTFNTLLWRLEDLTDGPEHAEVLDLLGKGRSDLANLNLQTPADPDKTFSDDPTRMLRAIKFVAKYGFKVPPDMVTAIRRNAPKLKGMPYNAIWKILTADILDAPNPRRSIVLMQDLGLADVLREMLQEEPSFASALSRSLSDKGGLLLLDLLDMGWAVRTPASIVQPEDRPALRTILLGMDDAEGKAFLEALRKPPINQEALFQAYNLKPRDRGQVAEVARTLLLSNPHLLKSPEHLESRVERELSGRLRLASQRVVNRYLSQRR